MVDGQWSTVDGQWLTVDGQWSMVNGQLDETYINKTGYIMSS